jgi:uncharacterized protein YabE (DUF348 family)/3D (Asp-Asp-Asp) domain-containing protein
LARSLPRPPAALESQLAIGRSFTASGIIDYSRSTRGRRHAIAILVVALLVVLGFQVFPLHDVTLVAGDQTVQVRSTFGDQEAALEAAAVELAPGDRLHVARMGDQSAVAVQRATPLIVVADGAQIEVRTTARTIAGALALADIEVRDRDRIFAGGLRTAPGAELEGIVGGTVEAASQGQPVRIEVVRALPRRLEAGAPADGLAAGPSAQPPALEAAAGEPVLSVLTDPFPAPYLKGAFPSGPAEAQILSEALRDLPSLRLVNLNIGGRQETLGTLAVTVAGILDSLGVELGELDRISHPLDAPVTEGMEVVILYVEKVIEEHVQYTEAKMYWRDDHTLLPGEIRRVEGTPGEVRVWEEVVYENGAEVSRDPHSAVIVSKPVAGEILKGPVAEDGVSPVVVDDYAGPYREKIRVWATWYNATHGWAPPGSPAYGITFTGVPLEYGICAVDPDYIPLGTRFHVPGYGECLAADTGGLINGYDIDLGFPEGHAPEPWHTGYVNIYILD